MAISSSFYLLIMVLLYFYYIGYKVRFSTDLAAHFVLLSLILVQMLNVTWSFLQWLKDDINLVAKTYLLQAQYCTDLIGRAFIKSSLYFFVFEMKIIAANLSNNSTFREKINNLNRAQK